MTSKASLGALFRIAALAIGFCVVFAILGWSFVGLAFSLEGNTPSSLTVALFSVIGFILVFPLGALVIFLSDYFPVGLDDNLVGLTAILLNGLFWFSTLVLVVRTIKRLKRGKKNAEQGAAAKS